MYIQKIILRNIGCFDDQLEIDVSSRSDPGAWLLVLGNNGVGKTTFLRSLALGLCPPNGVAALLSELYSDIINYNSPDSVGLIRIEFDREHNSESMYIETEIQYSESNDYDIKQNTCPKDGFPWKEIFVCGYGAMRGGYKGHPYREYSQVDSQISLFDYDATLQEPELALSRIKDVKVEKKIIESIEKLLLLNPSSLGVTRGGFYTKDKYQESMEISIGGWADGHRSTFRWIMDLIGWAILHDDLVSIESLNGIVIIDELEQHLHPIWQRRIIGLLKSTFKKIQFISSTHSSLCALGASDLEDKDCDLLVIERDEFKSIGRLTRPVRGKRADQILTSYLFGLDDVRDDDVSSKILRYAKLSRKKRRTKKEETEFIKIHAELSGILGTPENTFQEIIEKAINKTIEKEFSKKINNFDPESISFEIRRQLEKIQG